MKTKINFYAINGLYGQQWEDPKLGINPKDGTGFVVMKETPFVLGSERFPLEERLIVDLKDYHDIDSSVNIEHDLTAKTFKLMSVDCKDALKKADIESIVKRSLN